MAISNIEAAHYGSPESKPFCVTLWGSNPARERFLFRGEIVARPAVIVIGLIHRNVLMNQQHPLIKVCGYNWEFVMLDGPEIHEVTANPDQVTRRRHRREDARSSAEWRHECAMQAGMVFGCDGYNDEMGY